MFQAPSRLKMLPWHSRNLQQNRMSWSQLAAIWIPVREQKSNITEDSKQTRMPATITELCNCLATALRPCMAERAHGLSEHLKSGLQTQKPKPAGGGVVSTCKRQVKGGQVKGKVLREKPTPVAKSSRWVCTEVRVGVCPWCCPSAALVLGTRALGRPNVLQSW